MKIQKISAQILFAVLISITGFAQNSQPKEVGLGIVNLTKPNDFRDYKMPTGLYLDEAGTKICTSNEIMAFFSMPEVGIYNFVCLEVLESKYKVLINDTEIGYLPKNDLYEFDSWEDLMMQNGVRRTSIEGNPIRMEANANAQEIDHLCDYEVLKVDRLIEVDGEYWIHIKYWRDCEEREDIVSLMNSGYIKWRTDDELLVSVFVGC